MKRTAASGELVVKKIRIKVFGVENKTHTMRTLCPPAGQGWTTAAVDEILEKCGADLEARFPSFEFRLVVLGPAAFNFVYAGKREELPAERIPDDAASGMGVQGGE